MRFAALLAFGCLAPAMVHAQQPCAADLALLNGRIYTGNPERPWAEALSVCRDRVGQVGTTGEIRAAATPATRVVDLRGRLVLPGFNDAHVHVVSGAAELTGVNLRPARSADEMARLLGEYAAKQPKGRWILGGYWDHESWPGQPLPTRALLDAVTPEHPVFVKRLDGHMAVANSLALRIAGVDRRTAVPAGGEILRDGSGEPTGVLKDNAMDLVSRAVPPPTFEETVSAIRVALAHAASLGVTSLHDVTETADQLRAYRLLRDRGELPVRIYSLHRLPPDELERAGFRAGAGDDWVRVGGIKLFADGSMGSRTAAFFAPYADDPATAGLLLQSPQELEDLMRAADRAGFQLAVHAIGDRANALVLDALEKLHAADPRRDRRPRIEHAQVVRDEDKGRFARVNAIASIQPSHCIDDMRWAERRIGRERSRIAYDFRSFVDAGVHVAFGTDWYVEPLDPMLGLYAAVTRQFPDGTPSGGWFPEERLTLAQALEFYTRGSAYAEFAEDRKGTLAPGYFADLVVLSANLFDLEPKAFLSTNPVLTMVGGRIVYERPE